MSLTDFSPFVKDSKFLKYFALLLSIALFIASLCFSAAKIENLLSGSPPVELFPGWMILITGFFDIRWYANIFLWLSWFDVLFAMDQEVIFKIGPFRLTNDIVTFVLRLKKLSFFKKYNFGLSCSIIALMLSLSVFIPTKTSSYSIVIMPNVYEVYLGYYLWLSSIFIMMLFNVVKASTL